MLLPAALCGLLAAAASSTSERLLRTLLLSTAGWLLVVATLRWRRRAFIRTLETAEDPHQLAFYLAFVEFPFMFEAGTSFGFFNTFAVPTISAVLEGARGFKVCPQVRYDDTLLLMHEIGEFGPRSERGSAAIKRVNAIHARWKGIKRDDMAYTLWVFTFSPITWIERYEWRRLSVGEKAALWRFWREVGVALNIAGLPDQESWREFEEWGRNYETEKFAYRKAARKLTDQVVLAASRWGPPPIGSSDVASKEIEGVLQPHPDRAEGVASGPPPPSSSWGVLAMIRFKRSVLTTVICALCEQDTLLSSIGLEEEKRSVSWLLAGTLRTAVALRGVLIGLLLLPRPRSLAGTILGPRVAANPSAGGGGGGGGGEEELASQISCPMMVLSYRESKQYKFSEIGHPASYHAQVQKEHSAARVGAGAS